MQMEKIKIADACELLNGYAFKSEKYVESGIRIIIIANVQKGFIEDNSPVFYPMDLQELDKFMLKSGDLLVSLTGNVGRVAILEKNMLPAALNQRVACLRLKTNKINRGFLFHILNSDFFEQQCIQSSKGVAQKNMSTEWLKEYEISLYSLEEQRKITEILDEIRRIIVLRNKELEKLDNLIKARFVEMFGDVKTNIFGWKRCIFDEITTKITDGEHGTVPRVEEGKGHLYFMARNITKDGLIDLSEVSFVPDSVHQKIYKRCNPEANDILLVCVGATIGKSALVSEELGEFSMARSVALLKPNKEKVNSLFLLNLLRSDAVQNDISNCAHAAAQAGLYTNMIKKLDAFLPPMELQKEFADFAKQIDKSKVAVQKALDETQLLFDSLMQEYFG